MADLSTSDGVDRHGRNGNGVANGAASHRPPTDRRRPVSGLARVAPYRLLIEEGPDVFSRHDRAGRFLDASPAALPVLGRSPAALGGTLWRDLVHEEDREGFDRWWNQLHGGAPTLLAFRVITSDGATVAVQAAARAGVLIDDRVFEVQAVTRTP